MTLKVILFADGNQEIKPLIKTDPNSFLQQLRKINVQGLLKKAKRLVRVADDDDDEDKKESIIFTYRFIKFEWEHDLKVFKPIRFDWAHKYEEIHRYKQKEWTE